MQKKDFSSYSLLMIVILTHGRDNEELSASDKTYNLTNTIINPIIMSNKTLIDKPKIFVIQV